jgi:hypothetical protein
MAATTLKHWIGQVVVIDLRSPFVCIGKLRSASKDFLEVENADFHDLRDTQTTRENYVVAARSTGVSRNRERILIARTEAVAISRLMDVVGR